MSDWIFKDLEGIKAFIPQNIENKDVLKVFELLRKHSNISSEKIKENAATNQSILCKPNNGRFNQWI